MSNVIDVVSKRLRDVNIFALKSELTINATNSIQHLRNQFDEIIAESVVYFF